MENERKEEEDGEKKKKSAKALKNAEVCLKKRIPVGVISSSPKKKKRRIESRKRG